MKSKKKLAAKWAEAQYKCGLSEEAVQMAKESGIAPQVLMRKIPPESEPWQQSVEDWVRTVYMKRKAKEQVIGHSGRRSSAEERRLWFENLDSDIAKLEKQVGYDPHSYKLEDADIALDPGELDDESRSDWDKYDWEDSGPPSARDIDEQNLILLRHQRNFLRAAEHVAVTFGLNPAVRKVALFGSVAMPLQKEIPRFHRFRRAGVAVWHECRDVDLAVWVDDLGCLNELRRSLGRSLNELSFKKGIGVAHHQLDVHIMEPGTNRYRGRLCIFGQCPKPEKDECEVAGCGVRPFLQQFADYQFDRLVLFDDRWRVLFDRDAPQDQKPEAEAREPVSPEDEIPF